MTYQTLLKRIGPKSHWQMKPLDLDTKRYVAELAYTLPKQLNCWPVDKWKYLGGGCFGAVFQISKNRALKIFYGGWISYTEVKRTVEKLLKIKSPNIYRVLDYWKIDNVEFLITPVYRKAKTNKEYDIIHDFEQLVYGSGTTNPVARKAFAEAKKYKINTIDAAHSNLMFDKKGNLVLIDLV